MFYYPLPLDAHFNNDGISYHTDCTDGDFDGLGNTYPAEELPPSGKFTELGDASLLFPDKSDGALNNIVLEGQQIEIPASYFNSLIVIGASDSGRYAGGGYTEPVHLLYQDGEEEKELSLKDWLCIPEQRPGGQEALRCRCMHTPQGRSARSERGYPTHPTLWLEQIELDETRRIEQIRFADNPCMHVFALTLIAGQEG